MDFHFESIKRKPCDITVPFRQPNGAYLRDCSLVRLYGIVVVDKHTHSASGRSCVCVCPVRPGNREKGSDWGPKNPPVAPEETLPGEQGAGGAPDQTSVLNAGMLA